MIETKFADVRDRHGTRIDFSCCKIDDHGVKLISFALVQPENANVLELDLQHNDITDCGTGVLAKALGANNNVEAIHLHFNNISDVGVRTLCRSLVDNTSVTQIHLSAIHPGNEEGIVEKLKYLQKHREEDRVLDKCWFIERIQCIRENQTQCGPHQDFSGCQIEDQGVGVLADAIGENTQVEELDLRNNKISNRGANALAKALRLNRSVKRIDLRYNNITFSGINALVTAFTENKSLETIDLNGNDMLLKRSQYSDDRLGIFLNFEDPQ